jgi:predicted HicB family RNase H-like nuclease
MKADKSMVHPNSDSTEGTRMVHVRIGDQLHRRLRIFVASNDLSIQQWLSELISRELEETAAPLRRKSHG